MNSNSIPLDAAVLERSIGYAFKDRKFLSLALTHSSYSNEMKAHGCEMSSNERLEFLGDSVLSFVTSEYLYNHYSDLPEGELSKIRAAAVCEKTLHKLALQIELGNYLLLGRGEELTHGRSRPSILADAFEALLAALFLDGGIDVVKVFLSPKIIPEIQNIIATGKSQDYKTALQQLIQQDKNELSYVTVSESGPPHRKIFKVEAILNGNVIGHGTGTSKRSAEQCAAKEALKLFGVN